MEMLCHNTIIAEMNVSISPRDEAPRVNPYSSNIQNFCLDKGMKEDWIRFKMAIGKSDLLDASKGMDLEDKLLHLNHVVENAVSLIFPPKDNMTHKGNKIPKKARRS